MLPLIQSGGGGGGGGTTPTGTGFTHITSGSQDPAARAVNVASADITGILPPANGGEPVVNTANQGILTLPDPSRFSGASGNITVSSTLAPRIAQSQVNAMVTINKVGINVTSTIASQHVRIGIWDITGTTLLLDSGDMTTAGAASYLENTLGAPVTLNPGLYWYGVVADINTITGTGYPLLPPLGNASVKMVGLSGNLWAGAGNALPASLGTISVGLTNICVGFFRS